MWVPESVSCDTATERLADHPSSGGVLQEVQGRRLTAVTAVRHRKPQARARVGSLAQHVVEVARHGRQVSEFWQDCPLSSTCPYSSGGILFNHRCQLGCCPANYHQCGNNECISDDCPSNTYASHMQYETSCTQCCPIGTYPDPDETSGRCLECTAWTEARPCGWSAPPPAPRPPPPPLPPPLPLPPPSSDAFIAGVALLR